MPAETRNDLGGDETAQLPVMRDAHLEETEFIEFSNNLLEPEERASVLRHLDSCPRCREVLTELHRDDGRGSTKLSDPLLGQMVGEYRVDAALARGGMGVVYKGVQPMIGKQVAIKVLLPDAAEDPDVMHRLLAEARGVNSIRHPNIIDIFSFGEMSDGRHYFVMELLEGVPLNELAHEKEKLSPGEVMTVLEQAMSALGAAHEAGVIHRDLKPANLFVSTLPDRTWHITVLDFGLAKKLGASSSTSPNMVMGTPGFMAPEQIRGQKVTAKSDLYAMGVVAWVLLTGEEPFAAPSFVDLMMKHLQEPLPSLSVREPRCPPGLVKLVERLLAKRPEDRPESATEVLSVLQRLRKELEGFQTIRTPSPMMPLEDLIKASHRPKAAVSGRPEVFRDEAPTRLVRREAVTRARLLPPKEARVTDPAASIPELPPLARPSRSGVLASLGAVVLGLLGLVAWKYAGSRNVTPVGEVQVVETPPAPRPPVVEPPAPIAPVAVKEPEKEKEPPVAPKISKVSAPTLATVSRRVAQAREKAAKLESATARRMMTLDLDRLEGRLLSGDVPRTLNRDLDEILEKYGAP